MDAAGIDVQVLSIPEPVAEMVAEEVAVPRAVEANRQLHEITSAHPSRFVAFANLPVSAPEQAAAELERAVSELGFVGAMINGTVAGRFLDDPMFAPILEAAGRLGVPIYLHPGPPSEAVMTAYYTGFSSEVNRMLSTGAYGWHYEVSLHALRLILSGVFDRIPGLKLIIGHLGEGLPFHIGRIDDRVNVMTDLSRPVSAYLRDHFWFTTSGYPYDGPFHLARQTIGDDRLIFSVDYPFVDNRVVRDWFDQLDIDDGTRVKIAHGNADALLRLEVKP